MKQRKVATKSSVFEGIAVFELMIEMTLKTLETWRKYCDSMTDFKPSQIAYGLENAVFPRLL